MHLGRTWETTVKFIRNEFSGTLLDIKRLDISEASTPSFLRSPGFVKMFPYFMIFRRADYDGCVSTGKPNPDLTNVYYDHSKTNTLPRPDDLMGWIKTSLHAPSGSYQTIESSNQIIFYPVK